jgi:hypothetical protein
MAIDFNALRARKGTNFDSLQKKLETTGQTGGAKKDARIWKPVADKQNKSSNIIRFLPIPFVDLQGVEAGTIKEEDLTPMAKILKHAFQTANGWYIELSLQTFGEPCPIREHDRPLWGSAKQNKDEPLQKVLKKRIPKTDFYANVLVIKDGTNPENNGKVMLYQFGETVRKLIEACSKPEFDTDVPFDPFDMWEGADLNLNLVYEKKKIGEKEALVPSFDNVKWARNAPLLGGNEAEMERVWKEEHSIAEYYNRKNFKTFDEIKAKFEKAMGGKGASAPATKNAEEMLNDMTGVSSGTTEAKEPPSAPAPSTGGSADVPGDDLADFEALLNG